MLYKMRCVCRDKLGDVENVYTPGVCCEVLGNKFRKCAPRGLCEVLGHKGISMVRYRRVARGLPRCPYTARKPPRCQGAP